MSFFLDLWNLWAPFLLLALAAVLSDRAGSLNIALEGFLGLGTFVTAAAAALGWGPLESLSLGLLTGALAGGLLSATVQGLGADLFVAGLGLNLITPSLNAALSQGLFGHRGTLRGLPGLDPGWMSAGALLTVLAGAYLLQRSVLGLRLRAVGDQPALARSRGLPVGGLKAGALIVSGALASLAGGLLTLRLGAYVPGMSAGRGWMALVALYLGRRHPLGAALATAVFALADSLSHYGQGFSWMGSGLALALPYLVTLGALIGYALWRRRRT